jgi:PhzF family phenazine biosynthesis protein
MEYYVVDAFTDSPFGGNPAGIVVLGGPPQSLGLSDDSMQKVALEINLSETAFAWKIADRTYAIRYFTPSSEVDLCGHASLNCSHVLFKELRWEDPSQSITFEAKGGILHCKMDGQRITMDFPSDHVEPVKSGDFVLQAFKICREDVEFIGKGLYDYLVVVKRPEIISQIQPVSSLIAPSLEQEYRGIIFSSRTDSQSVDFISRFFAPNVGIIEDPVTGSAHCTLGPYWAAKLGKKDLVGHQVSRRGGIVYVSIIDDNTVQISGNAVTMSKSKFLIDIL